MEGLELPGDLAALPPGRDLGELLDALDLASVPNDRIDDVLIARSHQLAREQALMFEAVCEVLHRLPGAAPAQILRDDAPVPRSADEVRGALVWTRRTAEREADLSFTVVRRMPLVIEAMKTGRIDRGRAWVFAQHLVDLEPAQIEVICRAVVPIADRLTTGQLADRLRRLVLEIDPEFYERRYRRAVEQRRVIGYIDVDGSATIAAKGLPVEEAAIALQRVDALARAVRRAGHPGSIDQVRADVLLGLLDGSLHGMSREEIIESLCRGRAESAADTPSPAPEPASDAHGVEVRLALTTVLGRDERPGELPGWGPISAGTARRIVTQQRRAQWRFVVVDGEGKLAFDGITRRRPRHLVSGRRGGIVELAVSETDLDVLSTAEDLGPWAPVVADIAAQFAEREGVIQDLDAHPEARFPRAQLRRYVQARDRTCGFPGCRTPATRADVDHTHDHSQGGPTTAGELSPQCRHDHLLKQAGWTLEQSEPGSLIWRSPLGHIHVVEREPILPEPLEPPDPDEAGIPIPDDSNERDPRSGRGPPGEEPSS